MRRWAIPAVLMLFCVLLVSSQGACAAEVPLKFKDLQVKVYSGVFLQKYKANMGQQEMLKSQGSKYVSITALVEAAWTEAVKKVKVPKDRISLAVNGKKLAPVGMFRFYGILLPMYYDFWAYRHFRWPAKNKDAYYNVVFACPRSASKAVFHLGGLKQEIALPAKLDKAPHPSQIIKAKIIAVRPVKQMTRINRIGKRNVVSKLFTPQRPLLEVRVNFSPSRSNDMSNPRMYHWETSWFGAAYDNGGRSFALGERKKDGSIISLMSHALHNRGGKSYSAQEAALYFAAPPQAKEITLLFCNQPVAKAPIK